QGFAAIEQDAVAAAEADALDGQAAQADGVGGAGRDADADEAARNEGAGLADAVVDDADGLVDAHGAIAAGIEDRDLAVGQRVVVRYLKGAARRRAVAIVGVVPGLPRH